MGVMSQLITQQGTCTRFRGQCPASLKIN